MGSVKVINPGLLTLVEDSGRYGYQQYGVPVSGVMDTFSHRVSNILVGNHELEAGLEVTMMGPTRVYGSITPSGGDRPGNKPGRHPWGYNIATTRGFPSGLNRGRSHTAFPAHVPEVTGSCNIYQGKRWS